MTKEQNELEKVGWHWNGEGQRNNDIMMEWARNDGMTLEWLDDGNDDIMTEWARNYGMMLEWWNDIGMMEWHRNDGLTKEWWY